MKPFLQVIIMKSAFFFDHLKDLRICRRGEPLRLGKCAAALLLPLALISASGCGLPTYNIKLSYDSSMALPNGVYPSIEADVVALDLHSAQRLDGYPTESYFEPGDRFRSSMDKQTFYFSDERGEPCLISRDNSCWERWNNAGVTRLYVIANLPGFWEVRFGAMDGRRLNLPLTTESWPDGKDIEIVMKPSGLTLKSRLVLPKPPGQ